MRPCIAHFTFNMSTYSGAAKQALALIRHLDDFDSVVFNVERERRAVEWECMDGVTVAHLPPKWLPGIVTVIQTVIRRRIRIFHLHGLVGIGLLVGRVLRRRIVLKTTLLGGDDFDSIRTKPNGRVTMHMLRQIDVNVVLSRAMGEISSRHLEPRRIHHIPNGVAIPAEDPSPKHEPIFCVVGLICERKRTHAAVEAFLNGYADDPDALLYVVGPEAGDFALDEADAHYARHCRTIVPPEHAHQVVFTGPLEEAALQRIYDEALAFFCFSSSEGMPNSLLEAMARNCVPIVGPIGGVAREIVPDADVGFVIDRDDTLPPLERIRAVSRSLAPHARVARHHALPTLARRYAELYRGLLD